MRNLKKVLSLALALVMLLGMMMVGAGAADTGFEDDGTIKDGFKTAAAVTKALGVMEGSNGNLNPTGKIVRAEAYILALRVDGSNANTLAANWPVNEKPFNDVSTGKWYAHYIAYGKAMGDLKGTNGYYNPDKNVTAVEYAILLLKRLGFDSERYVGDMWAANAITDGVNTKLFDGLGSMNYQTHELTREEACQMAFNAITKYSPSNSAGYIVEGGTPSTTVVFGSMMEALLYQANQGAATKGTIKPATAGDTLAATVYKLASSTTSDALGRPVTQWTKNGKPLCVTDSTDAPYKTYTETKTGLANGDLKDHTYASGLKYTENGVEKAAITSAANIETLTGNGKTVEVYTDSNKKVIRVVVIAPTVATVSADPVTRTSGDKEEVRIPGVVSAWTETKKVTGWEDLAKGDVVLYVKAKDGKYTIEKAETVTGTVAAYSTTKGVQIDGTYYPLSNVTGVASTLLSTNWNGEADKFKTEWTFYLDASGAVVSYVKAGEDASSTASNYAIVREVAWFAGDGFSPNGHMEAKILKTDGTYETVTVTSVDGVVPVTEETTASALKKSGETDAVKTNPTSLSAALAATMGASGAHETIATHKVTDKTYLILGPATDNAAATSRYFGVKNNASLTDGTAKFITIDQFYAYEVDSDGNYALTNLKSVNVGKDTGTTLANHVITKGAAKFDGTTLGNAKTVFLFDNGAGKAPTFYTGINEVPTTAAAPTNHTTNGGNVVIKGADGFAKFVFVKGVTVQNASADVVYIADLTAKNTTAVGDEYEAFVNGVEGTVTVAAGTSLSGAGLFYVESVNDKGVSKLANAASGGSANTAVTPDDAVKANSSPVISAGSNSYTYGEDTVVWTIAKEGITWTSTEGDAVGIELDANDKVYVIPGGTGEPAKAIYVVKVDAPKPTVTVADNATGDMTGFPTADSGAIANGSTTKLTVGNTNSFDLTVSAQPSNHTQTVSLTKNGTAVAGFTGIASSNVVSGAVADDVYVLTVTMKDNFSGIEIEYTYTIKVVAAG